MLSSPKSDLHEAALSYVAQGYRIIPIVPGAKTPMLSDWRNSKLDTPEKVDAWFTEHPDCNLAFEPEDMGYAIIDGDTYHETCNIGALALPYTYEVSTPRGGTHFYFVGSVPTSVGDESKPDKGLGPHIDTRGRGSYALLPPSQINGKRYEVRANRSIVALPVEIEARLQARDHQSSTVKELDLPGNIARATSRLLDHVRGKRLAIIGQRGHDTCYEIACELVRDLGLSAHTALALMLEHWYPHCEPNNDPDFVRERILSAVRNGQNAPGAYAVVPPDVAFAGANLPATTQAAPLRWFMNAKEQAELPEPSWLIKDVLPERKIVILVAPKGQFKTFIALEMCMAIATGQDTFGTTPTSSGLVFYGDHESTQEIAKLHRPAWQIVHGLEPNEETGFYLSREGPHKAIEGEMDSFADECAAISKQVGRPIRLIVFDTYSATMLGLDENDPNDANGFVRYCRSLIQQFGCTVLALTHTGKDRDRGARGTSALPAGVDTVLEVAREENTNIVNLRVVHHRHAPEKKGAFKFEGRPVAGSLVFTLLTPEETSALELTANPFDHRKVALALRSLGAVHDQTAVMTRVLAMALAPQEEDESQERYDARLELTDRTLRRLARSSLDKFTYGEGKHLRWCLPPGVTSDPDGLD